jgi:hypothetical protein
MTSALTRDDLDETKCAARGCQNDHPLVLNSACHPGVPLFVEYHKDEGVLVMQCAECGEVVVLIQVAWAT